MPSFFQAHRDEVITMVANPVVDQVISAGLGESKFSVYKFENVRYLALTVFTEQEVSWYRRILTEVVSADRTREVQTDSSIQTD